MNAFKMPEPIGTYDVTHIGPFRSRIIEVTETSLADGKYDIFTADQLRQAAHDALEMASRISEKHFHTTTAKQIRALKEQIK